MHATALLIALALVAACDGKTVGAPGKASADGAGGGLWRTHDAASDAAEPGGARGAGAAQSTASGGAHGTAPDGAAGLDASRAPRSSSDAGETASLPECAHLARSVDGGVHATCIGARTYLTCQALHATPGSGLAGETCLSDDPTRCPPGLAEFSGPFTCRDDCGPTEYAVGCAGGAFGAPTVVTLPVECREINGRVGAVYCCPCGS